MKIYDHLKTRYLNINKYHCFISEEEQCVTFLIFNLSGQIIGYQIYRPNADKQLKQDKRNLSLRKQLRYYTYISKQDKNPYFYLFGLETLDNTKPIIFLVEGIFDACRIHNLELNCLALLSCETSKEAMKNFLYTLKNVYEFIPICEGDKAGQKMKKYSTHGRYIELPECKDLGDFSKSEVFSLFKKFL